MIKMSLRGGKVESLEEEMEEMEIWRSVTGRRGIRLKAMASGPALESVSLLAVTCHFHFHGNECTASARGG